MSGTPLFEFTLRLADTALVLGHRLSEWVGHSPVLEEDLAFGNMGLDLIGQARSLYTYAGELEGEGRDEDALAYLRDAADYRNILLVEQPNGDFATTMVRQLLYAAQAHPYFEALAGLADERLAGVAAKAAKEMVYHLRHSAEWVIRLGDGTNESHRRVQHALNRLWPYTAEMFEVDDLERSLVEARIAPDRGHLRHAWDTSVDSVLDQATLPRAADGFMQTGGQSGRHSEHLGYILAELQFLQRAYPGAVW